MARDAKRGQRLSMLHVTAGMGRAGDEGPEGSRIRRLHGSVLLDFPDNGLVVIVLGNLDEASGNVVPELALSLASRFSHR
jgi:hypothetical protein